MSITFDLMRVAFTLLCAQNAYAPTHLRCRNKVEIHTRRADVAKEKLVEIMRAYEQKLQTQAIDVQRLQELCNRLGSDKSDCHTMHQQPELMAETLRKYQM